MQFRSLEVKLVSIPKVVNNANALDTCKMLLITRTLLVMHASTLLKKSQHLYFNAQLRDGAGTVDRQATPKFEAAMASKHTACHQERLKSGAVMITTDHPPTDMTQVQRTPTSVVDMVIKQVGLMFRWPSPRSEVVTGTTTEHPAMTDMPVISQLGLDLVVTATAVVLTDMIRCNH